MNEEFFKNILSNLDNEICICDEKNNVLYANFETEKTFANKDNFACKTFTYDKKQYKLFSKNNSSLDQAHLDFISTVSHELRTPLTSIRGFADTMLSSADKLSKEQTTKFLNIIRNQSDRLTRLVENLLEISNFSRKDNIILKSIDFTSFINPLIMIFERKYQNHTYKINIQKNLPPIWADSDMLEQIMTNLIDNASKYSIDSTEIKIDAIFIKNFIEISITNIGEQLPPDALNKIFNKFSRIDNPLTRKVQGSGLGLFITKNLTEKLKGTITAKNNDDGVSFILSIPCFLPEEQMSSKMGVKKDD